MDPAADDLKDVPSRSAAEPSRAERSHTYRYFFVELLIVTAGVLIALSVDSLREWNQYRMLVSEARATSGREIADNQREVDIALSDVETRKTNIRTALTLANDLLATKKSDIQEFRLGFALAELSAAGWHSAERTALGHMEYSEVQKYSRLYAFQELYVAQQRQAVQRLAAAIALLSDTNPHEAQPDDLRAFRQHLLVLGGELDVEGQLAKKLSELYAEALK
jgi:hypothetical protein